MSICVDLYKINKKKCLDRLMKISGINDKNMLEKIIGEFTNEIGDFYVYLHNEYYEDGDCDWNLFIAINKYFNLDEDDSGVDDVFYDLREPLIAYKDLVECADNLGIDPELFEDDEDE